MSTMQQQRNHACSLAAVSAAADQLIPTFVYKHVSHVTEAAGSKVFV